MKRATKRTERQIAHFEEKRKRIKNCRSRNEREKSRFQMFYLAHIVLLSVFLLLFGVWYAGTYSERTGSGKTAEMIGLHDAEEWLREKWDLFFDDISAKIVKK